MWYLDVERFNVVLNQSQVVRPVRKLKKLELPSNSFIMSSVGTTDIVSSISNNIDKVVFNQALIRFRINNWITDSECSLQFTIDDFLKN